MSFEEFCKTNMMTEIETESFRTWLENKKEDLSDKPIQNWLNIFNNFYDDPCSKY